MTEKLTLTELQLVIRDTLYLSFPDSYWVIAEISELKENNAGHCYLELIEKNADEKNVTARIRAIIWCKRFRFLRAFFENTTGETLREGIKVLVKAKIEYHELYGLSLIISDIDPAFTLGEMAVKRQAIIRKLEEDGVFFMNKELPFPIVPQKIAVISSRNAAGYSDFINQLRNNSFGYIFYTALFEASLQGTDTEQSTINALDMIALVSHLFDVVVIIRGGGSQSDLSWFDNYNIAYYITQFPLPVITGIGHDKDISITDMVANRSLKTPTAVADFIVESVAGTENHIMSLSSDIVSASRSILEKGKNRIETFGIKLFPLARVMVSNLKDQLSASIIELVNTGKFQIVRAGVIPANLFSRLYSAARSWTPPRDLVLSRSRQRLLASTTNIARMNNLKIKGFESALQLLDPEKILQRGYSITSVRGKVVKDPDQVEIDDIIDTRTYQGNLKSKVTSKQVTPEKTKQS
jgi:exodeoxyribonuclease VII large subunit